MKFIKKFNNYDFIGESLISESVLYFSPPLRDKLRAIDSDISKKLLELEGTDVKSDVTFVDLVNGSDDGIVSFMPMRQGLTKIKNAYPDANNSDLQGEPNIDVNDAIYVNDIRYNNSNVYKSMSRNVIKVGKFIKKVLGNLPDDEVENFVNNFKTASVIGSLKVELVSGKDITYWYNSDNYESIKGSLGSSCMAGKQFFQLYEENPEVCQLAIIEREGKLIARALVWKVESDNSEIKYYMDRPYSIMDHYVSILTDWAKSKDMALWTRSFGCVEFRGKEIYPDMKVKINKLNYDSFPYLDTFRRYDYRKGYLHNDQSYKKRGYQLVSTSGTYSRKNDRTRLQRLGDYFGLGESNLN